ncbi:MAG: SusC/RagA family TonB-linked outer membrane protein, partial [Bacteroidetes bacterium]|nr:SusC/RagA family TonB-linked outer membrane protein [Bacteroidota bacterium]
MKARLLVWLMLLGLSRAFGQTGTVTGRVTDEKNNPLRDVSVLVKGTGQGTKSGADGGFSIKVGNLKKAVLRFSFVGYGSQDLALDGRTYLLVLMEPAGKGLGDVIVVGYRTQSRAKVTGAVASLKGEEVMTTRNENLVNSLQGKIPGVRIVQNTAEPGSFNSSFDIRGLGNPLVIIDGVPRSNIARLDPDDIESISILKDASAAVYGVEAGNGVVLITTKRGKAGASQINYTVTGGLQAISNYPKLVDAVQWMTLINESTMHNIANPTITYPDSLINLYKNGALKSTDWNSIVLRKTTPQWQHSLTVSGGSDRINYFLSMGYLYQDGFYRSNDLNYKKYNVRSNITARIASHLTAELQLSGISDVKHQPYDAPFDIFGNLWRVPPTQSLYANNDPHYLSNLTGNYGTNPYALTHSDISGYQLLKNQFFQGGITLTYDVPFIPGLKVKGFYSYDYTVTDNKGDQQAFNLYDPVAPATSPATYVAHLYYSPSTVSRSYNNINSTLQRLTLDYTHTFAGAHNVQVLVLYEGSASNSDNFS